MQRKKKIVNAYNELFKKDPLLLSDKNQKKYCDLLLNNILENRTIHTSEAVEFDLHKPSDHAKFERKVRTDTPSLSSKAVDDYRNAYLQRKPIPKTSILNKLKSVSMVMNPRATQKRIAAYTEHDAAATELDGAGSSLDKRIRIAAIGYRVRISAIPEQALLGEELCMLAPADDKPVTEKLPETIGVRELGRTHETKCSDAEEWADTVAAYIKHAHRRKSHVIFLPEFTMPVANAERPSFDQRLARLCADAKYDHFLFGGSRHEGAYNRGLVFQTKDKVLNEKWAWHYKIASARTLGENILGPHHNKVASYSSYINLPDKRTVDLAISIALCYDAFDPSVFLSLVRQGRELTSEQWQTVILVPSFNPSEVFVALLRDLSFVTRSTVVYVNGLHGNAKMFICGFAISDLAGNVDRIKVMIAAAEKTLEKRRRGIREGKAGRLRRVELTALQQRTDALTSLHDSLSALAGARGFDHMITVESCPECAAKDRTHRRLSHCERDVMYYNIDPKLVLALRRFREDYIDDRHLPSALRK
jgi:predicted amidohydrolase